MKYIGNFLIILHIFLSIVLLLCVVFRQLYLKLREQNKNKHETSLAFQKRKEDEHWAIAYKKAELSQI